MSRSELRIALDELSDELHRRGLGQVVDCAEFETLSREVANADAEIEDLRLYVEGDDE